MEIEMTPENLELLREAIARALRERADFPPVELGFACESCAEMVRYSFAPVGKIAPEEHHYSCGCGMIAYSGPQDFDADSWAVAIRNPGDLNNDWISIVHPPGETR
jgi:hypothetical protein